MDPELLLIPIGFSLFALLIGLYLFFKPERAIEIQRRFYEKINWKLVPISMSREVFTTRVMGLTLIILVFVTLTYVFVRYIC